MRIAICFYGLAGKKNNFQNSHNWMQDSDESLDCNLSYNHYKNHIFDKKPFRPNESILCNWCYYWEECPAKSTPNPYI